MYEEFRMGSKIQKIRTFWGGIRKSGKSARVGPLVLTFTASSGFWITLSLHATLPGPVPGQVCTLVNSQRCCRGRTYPEAAERAAVLLGEVARQLGPARALAVPRLPPRARAHPAPDTLQQALPVNTVASTGPGETSGCPSVRHSTIISQPPSEGRACSAACSRGGRLGLSLVTSSCHGTKGASPASCESHLALHRHCGPVW